MRTIPPKVSAANSKQTTSREWVLGGEDFSVSLLGSDFGLIAYAMPVSMVPESKVVPWHDHTASLPTALLEAWDLG